MLKISKENLEIIKLITDPTKEHYVDLPRFLARFHYPVSLELSEYIGKTAYQRGFADALEFLCLMANKFYTRIKEDTAPQAILEMFIVREGNTIKEKTGKLITTVKKWEMNVIGKNELAEEITDFCLRTFGVRIPMASFFLRMLLPNKFGTVDVRCINALKSLGFNVKELPPEDSNKETYLQQYNGSDYLKYNDLLIALGKNYKIRSKFGEERPMMPSEVDMALYQFDKEFHIYSNARLRPARRTLSRDEKIKEIMRIIEEIVKGTENGPLYVKKAGRKLWENMKKYEERGDLEGIFRYCCNLKRGRIGKSIKNWLEKRGLPSIESEFEKIRKIYHDC